MGKQFTLGDIVVDVLLKDIKNVHLSVHPPTGHVRVSAPSRMSLDTIRVFTLSRLKWIKEQQRRLQRQERETPREYLDRESHYVWGRRCLLKVVEGDGASSVELKHQRLILRVRPATREQAKRASVDQWYRQQVREAALRLVAKWEPVVGVQVARLYVRRMRTRWGGCNPTTRSIRLNTDLAKKPSECLEYIIVHEMVHLVEPSHNRRFVALMDRLLPRWRFLREQLNRLPVRHEEWVY